jgi:hypothetical protein
MEAITQNTKELALNVLYQSFKDVPGALWVVKKDQYIQQRIEALCRFCLNTSMLKDGAYISSDLNGVALLFDSRKKLKVIPWLMSYIRLGNECIGWNRAISIIRREYTIQKKRPKTPYLYFWMIAVNENKFGLETIIELRDFAYHLSRQKKLPIYAETTSLRNKNLYLRYGFEVYHTWVVAKQKLTIWFLRRPVEAGGIKPDNRLSITKQQN